MHRLGETIHELVGAIGDEEHDAEVACPRHQRSIEIAREAEPRDGFLDLFGCGRADTRTAIEHPIHSRQRHSCGPGHIMDRGPASDRFFAQTCSPTARELRRRTIVGATRKVKCSVAARGRIALQLRPDIWGRGNDHGHRSYRFRRA